MKRIAVAGLLAVAAAGVCAAQAAGKPQRYEGLEMTVTKVERAPSASLRDCPPGTNTVSAVAKPGEQFALVTIAIKVGSGAKAGALNGKRPTAGDAADKKYFTPSWLNRGLRIGYRFFLHFPISRGGRDPAEEPPHRNGDVRPLRPRQVAAPRPTYRPAVRR